MIMESRDKRWLALAVVCMGQLMMILDATIVAVALPAIKTDLHFSSSSLTWVMNAYLIAFGSFLLLGGRLGDLIGRTRMFLTGIAIFTGASMLCGLASSEAMLIGARFVQGLGAAAAASAILALIVVEFPDARERVRAMSAYTFVSVAAAMLTAFLAVERRVASPILPLEIMRLRSLMIACGVRALMVCGMWASFFVGALYLERVLGMGPVAAGAAFLPQTLTVAAFSLGPTARLTARFGERRMLLFGLTVLVAGLGL